MNPSKLRILTFTTLFPNQEQQGHGLFVRERVRALAEIGDLRVVAPVPWFPRVRASFSDRYYRYSLVPRTERQFGLIVDHPRYVVIPKLLKMIDPLLLALGCKPFLKDLRPDFRFNVLDAHWAYPDGVAAALLARQLRVPFSITVRGDDLNVFLGDPSRRQWIRWALQRADLVIALSGELRDRAVAAGASGSRVAVIPNGINTEAFQFIDRQEARAHLGIDADRQVVLSVGRLHKSKGFDTLVACAGRLLPRFPALHVYIAGAPDHEADARPAILATAQSCNIQDRVHLIGVQPPDTLKYWYAAADLFCLPTAREGSANALIEAKACGLPSVTTPVGGNAQVVDSEEVGLIADGDVESMTQALDSALRRTWNRRQIAARGQARTWQTVARECRERLFGLVASSRLE